MTPSEAYDLSKFNLVGRKVVVGPDAARIETITPLRRHAFNKLKWPSPWLDAVPYQQGETYSVTWGGREYTFDREPTDAMKRGAAAIDTHSTI